MNRLIKTAAALFSIVALSGFAYGSGSIVGVWRGKMLFDQTKIPKHFNAKQIESAKQRAATMTKGRLTLTIKADHSFSILLTGLPNPQPMLKGTWTQSSPTKVSLKPAAGTSAGSPKEFTIAAGGKKMAYTLGPVTIAFSR